MNNWEEARRIVEEFDARYDVPLRRHVALGNLESLGVFASKDAPAAVRLGADWCRLVDADMRYELLEGLALIERTRPRADLLASELDVDSAEFAAYAVARWHDGAGRVRYRTGDYAEARLHFARACELADRHGLWWCVPDMTGNRLRAQVEEAQAAAQPLPDEAALLEEALAVFAADTQRKDAEHRIIEFRRGLCNLNHNLSIARRKAAKRDGVRDSELDDAAMTASKRAHSLAQQNGDHYRIAQAQLEQASQWSSRGDSARARALFAEVAASPWLRGQRIARQQHARFAPDAELESAIGTLTHLLDEVRAERRQRQDGGLDTDFLVYTTKALRGTLGRAATPEVLRQAHAATADEAELDALRSVREVIKIGKYKSLFNHIAGPVYQRRLAALLMQAEKGADARTQVDGLDSAFSVLEEFSGRRLLDAIQANAAQVLYPNGLDMKAHLALLAKRKRQVRQVLPEFAGSTSRRRSAVRDATFSHADSAALAQRQAFFEDAVLSRPIRCRPHDPDISHALRMFVAHAPEWTVVRYAEVADGDYRAFIFMDSLERGIKTVRLPDAPSAIASVRTAMQKRRESRVDQPAVTKAMGDELWAGLLAPIWTELPTEPQRLLLIPTGPIFEVPLHIATHPSSWPLAACIPLAFSASASAFIGQRRYQFARQRVEPDDDLCALVCRDLSVSAGEIINLDWPRENFYVAGRPPTNVDCTSVGRADLDGIAGLMEPKPEFFVYAGHGVAHKSLAGLSGTADTGAALVLDDDLLTQLDVALWMRLPRNKLTMIGACVSAVGTEGSAGEVAGFLRAFMAAGSGALALTLWEVLDDAVVRAGQAILGQIRRSFGRSVDLPELFRLAFAFMCAGRPPEERLEHCPFALYL